MSWTSVSTSQMAIIVYSIVILRERFFAHVTVRGVVKFFIVEMSYGYVSSYDSLYIMR